MKVSAASVVATSAVAAAVALSACSAYVKRDDYDPAIAGLQSADAAQTSRIDSLRDDLAALRKQVEAHDQAIARLAGRIRVDSTAHFSYDDARLQEEDKDALRQFAEAVSEFHPDILVTVEGFADPAGSAAYNTDLGQRRAEAVRSFLVSAGMPANKVRAVSYGEDRNRQVQPGAWGKDGPLNRRATLVVDYVVSSRT